MLRRTWITPSPGPTGDSPARQRRLGCCHEPRADPVRGGPPQVAAAAGEVTRDYLAEPGRDRDTLHPDREVEGAAVRFLDPDGSMNITTTAVSPSSLAATTFARELSRQGARRKSGSYWDRPLARRTSEFERVAAGQLHNGRMTGSDQSKTLPDQHQSGCSCQNPSSPVH